MQQSGFEPEFCKQIKVSPLCAFSLEISNDLLEARSESLFNVGSVGSVATNCTAAGGSLLLLGLEDS